VIPTPIESRLARRPYRLASPVACTRPTLGMTADSTAVQLLAD
jgi:hypothetical protein